MAKLQNISDYLKGKDSVFLLMESFRRRKNYSEWI